MSRDEDLGRIKAALLRAAEVAKGFDASRVDVRFKGGNSPVTEADDAVDEALRESLPRGDEGWLSEESADDRARLVRRRVWIVDPIDGTREFLEGVPHWTISIGLAEDGEAVAGGIYNPSTGELFLGAREAGATLNGEPMHVSTTARLAEADVLANQWAMRKRTGELTGHGFHVRVVSAMAYSLALIAAGRADALWSRSAKHEWDIAAGVALIAAAGGRATDYAGAPLPFNAWPPRAPGIIASSAALHADVRRFVRRLPPPRRR
jgi:myo-inositol-1(or 4)-monophosphatase